MFSAPRRIPEAPHDTRMQRYHSPATPRNPIAWGEWLPPADAVIEMSARPRQGFPDL
jgi:hypothetical protein